MDLAKVLVALKGLSISIVLVAALVWMMDRGFDHLDKEGDRMSALTEEVHLMREESSMHYERQEDLLDGILQEVRVTRLARSGSAQ